MAVLKLTTVLLHWGRPGNSPKALERQNNPQNYTQPLNTGVQETKSRPVRHLPKHSLSESVLCVDLLVSVVCNRIWLLWVFLDVFGSLIVVENLVPELSTGPSHIYLWNKMKAVFRWGQILARIKFHKSTHSVAT